jgi:hypothetical protein
VRWEAKANIRDEWVPVRKQANALKRATMMITPQINSNISSQNAR